MAATPILKYWNFTSQLHNFLTCISLAILAVEVLSHSSCWFPLRIRRRGVISCSQHFNVAHRTNTTAPRVISVIKTTSSSTEQLSFFTIRVYVDLTSFSHDKPLLHRHHVTIHLPPLFLFKYTPPILMVFPTKAGESSFENMTFGLSSVPW